MADVSLAQVIGTAAVGIATGIIGYATAARNAQSKDKEVERDLMKMAREMVDEAMDDLRGEVKQIREERRKDSNNFEKLRKKWTELHTGLIKLRASFEASDIHLGTFISLSRTNPKAAASYLDNLEGDRAALKVIVSELCDISEPIFDGRGSFDHKGSSDVE